jgi:molybdopterin/thiamine biosynthesis adenylyltransferase
LVSLVSWDDCEDGCDGGILGRLQEQTEGELGVPSLTDSDRTRYHRQMLIDGWGERGQIRLKSSTVFIAGAGGLGSPVALYLAAAGVGEIRICDADTVELSNLNRQILHNDATIGDPKTASAARTLGELNPTIKVLPFSEYLEQSNVERLVGRSDIVVDCLDNFETRYLLNAYCVQNRIPFVHGAVQGLIGQVTFLCPPETPCLECLIPEAPPKAVFPVLGATPGVIGCLQAMEVVKYLTAVGSNLKGRLLFLDGEEGEFSSLAVKRLPTCPQCGGLG